MPFVSKYNSSHNRSAPIAFPSSDCQIHEMEHGGWTNTKHIQNWKRVEKSCGNVEFRMSLNWRVYQIAIQNGREWKKVWEE